MPEVSLEMQTGGQAGPAVACAEHEQWDKRGRPRRRENGAGRGRREVCRGRRRLEPPWAEEIASGARCSGM